MKPSRRRMKKNNSPYLILENRNSVLSDVDCDIKAYVTWTQSDVNHNINDVESARFQDRQLDTQTRVSSGADVKIEVFRADIKTTVQQDNPSVLDVVNSHLTEEQRRNIFVYFDMTDKQVLREHTRPMALPLSVEKTLSFLPKRIRDPIIGDLVEDYPRLIREKGPRRAYWQCWWEVLYGMWPLLRVLITGLILLIKRLSG